VRDNSATGILTAKFKNLRHELKRWGKNLSHIKLLIDNSNKVIIILDKLEEERDLSSLEFNFRNIAKMHLKRLLQIQSDYWKKKVYHSMGSIEWGKYKKNSCQSYREV
jgi:hypothetical protein